MTLPWPSFLRRALLLRRARLALEGGDPGRCLDHLREPGLALSDRAEKLRLIALEQLSREARRLAASGEMPAVDGIVARLTIEDPPRANEIRRELGLSSGLPRGGMIGSILAHVRASSGAGSARPSSMTAAPPRLVTIPRVIAPDASASHSDADVVRFHLAVDDGGEYFVAGGPALILGHLRSESANLPFLADVENRHVRFTCTESFHAGMRWSIARVDARDVRVNGRSLGDAPQELKDGDEVVLARNLALRFRQPDATSGSALLDLASGAECQGVRRIVLLTAGDAGRVRIGSRRNRHIPVPDLAHEVELEWSKGELRVSCTGGVRLSGGPLDPSVASSISIPCPLRAASSFVLGARAKSGPPFGIHVRPTEPPPSTGAHRA